MTLGCMANVVTWMSIVARLLLQICSFHFTY
jgi:hypothetical protein